MKTAEQRRREEQLRRGQKSYDPSQIYPNNLEVYHEDGTVASNLLKPAHASPDSASFLFSKLRFSNLFIGRGSGASFTPGFTSTRSAINYSVNNKDELVASVQKVDLNLGDLEREVNNEVFFHSRNRKILMVSFLALGLLVAFICGLYFGLR